jgi:hypothetical protein
MAPDDEVLFGRVCDDSRSSFERVERLVSEALERAASAELAIALAEFELHGATLRSLLQWYPDETLVRSALIDWELSNFKLASKGLPIDVPSH